MSGDEQQRGSLKITGDEQPAPGRVLMLRRQ
jgi:hypothetical protein